MSGLTKAERDQWAKFSPGIQKVLRHVARTHGWLLRGGVDLRRPFRHLLVCPLASLTRKSEHRDYTAAARREFGISAKACSQIMCAADDIDADPRLRTVLLHAARLA